MTTTPDLKDAWTEYRAEHPRTRHRQAAGDLEVAEAQLVAAECGLEATRLTDDFGALLQDLKPLGPLMALTRNDAAVHEKTGVYRGVELHDTHRMGQVLAEQIDLRLFLGRWKYGFAVALEKGAGVLRGFQFFDEHGTAVHKIYLQDESDEAAYYALVDRYRAGESAPSVRPEPVAESPETPDEEIDAEAFLEGWRSLEDTHDFFTLLREHDVGRVQALRLGEGEFTERADPAVSHRHVLEAARDGGVPIMVFVRSPGTVQIHTGPVNRLKGADGWFNVLDEGFNLHLCEDLIDRAWVVEKPTTDGRVTSLECYDAGGHALVKFFGERKPGRPERDEWRAVLDEVR